MPPSTPTSRRSRSTISRSTSIASRCSSRRSGRSSSRTPASSASAIPVRSICSSAAASASATNGQSIPILGGARVSGKAGKFNVGLLNMQTVRLRRRRRRAPTSASRASAATCRTARRSARSSPTARRPAISPRDDEYGRTIGLDGKLGIGMTSVLTGFLAKTDTPGVDDGDYAYNMRSQTNRPQWDLNVGYQEVGERIQSGDRLSQPPRLSQARRLADDALPSEGLHQHPGTAPALRPSAASGASMASRRPASCISTTTGSSATAPRSTPA